MLKFKTFGLEKHFNLYIAYSLNFYMNLMKTSKKKQTKRGNSKKKQTNTSKVKTSDPKPTDLTPSRKWFIKN